MANTTFAAASGQYTVTVQAPGFATAEVKNVAITVDSRLKFLSPCRWRGPRKWSREFGLRSWWKRNAPLPPTPSTSGHRNLPINGRNYLIRPHRFGGWRVIPSQHRGRPHSGAEYERGSGPGANLVNVDGADAVEQFHQRLRSTVSQEGVQEFQIITNGYAAEYGTRLRGEW